MKVYVDDTLVKSSTVEQYVKDLAQTLAMLRAHKMMLNLAKCTFTMKAEQFLGFMVSHYEIEASLEKIKVFLEMAPSKVKKNSMIDRVHYSS